MANYSVGFISKGTTRYNYDGGKANLPNKNNGDERITVTMKGTTPAAHADAILKHFGMSKVDERAFEEKFGYDLRQYLTDNYSKNDSAKSHRAVGGGKYEVLIPISSGLIGQIKQAKSERQTAAVGAPTANPNQVIAERNGYDQSAQTRSQLEKKLPPTPSPTPSPHPTPTPIRTANTAGVRNVSQMTITEKLEIVINKAVEHLGPEAGAKLKQLITPENIAIMAGTTAALIAVQGVPVLDVIVDAAVLGLAAYSLGGEALSAISDLADFASKTLNAKTEADLDDAGKSLAKATATVGVDALAALLIHKGVKSIKAGELPPPNTRVVEMVTPEGFRVKVRVPVEAENPNILESRSSNVGENNRRNLDSHEGVSGVTEGKQIGHTILKHVGKSEKWLQERVIDEGIPSASSFRNYEVGNRTVGAFKKLYEAEINQWLKSKTTKPFEAVIDMKKDIGLVVNRNKKGTPLPAERATKATIRLVKDNSEFGWHLFTVKLQK